MFLFSSRNSPFDDLVEKATNESLSMGSENLATFFEICDLIRGKSVPAKEAMRSLKKRIMHKAANVQFLALKLTDTCVKNGGHHFLTEIASCEFMDSLVSQLRIQTLSQPVRVLILQYIQSWALAFRGNPDLEYVPSIYSSLKEEGCWSFPPPPVEDKLGGKAIMIDTVTIPDWTDSSDCERCRTAFTFMNRKHHCRACGRTVCQDCSSKSIPLPHFGIKEEVRVCDNCFATKGKPSSTSSSTSSLPSSYHAITTTNSTNFPLFPKGSFSSSTLPSELEAKEQEEMELAIALSLADPSKPTSTSSFPPVTLNSTTTTTTSTSNPSSLKHPQPSSPEDPDLARAIAASLADMKAKSQTPSAPPPSTTATTTSSSSSSSSISFSSTSLSSTKTMPPTQVTSPPLSDLELSNIHLFSQMIQKIEAQGQAHAILQSKEIASLNQSMAALQPKLVTWLHETLATHHELSEMHSRLSEAVHLYETMLQQRLLMGSQMYSHAAVPPPPHPSSSSSMGYGSSMDHVPSMPPSHAYPVPPHMYSGPPSTPSQVPSFPPSTLIPSSSTQLTSSSFLVPPSSGIGIPSSGTDTFPPPAAHVYSTPSSTAPNSNLGYPTSNYPPPPPTSHPSIGSTPSSTSTYYLPPTSQPQPHLPPPSTSLSSTPSSLPSLPPPSSQSLHPPPSYSSLHPPPPSGPTVPSYPPPSAAPYPSSNFTTTTTTTNFSSSSSSSSSNDIPRSLVPPSFPPSSTTAPPTSTTLPTTPGSSSSTFSSSQEPPPLIQF